jgi:hypothetical protein
MWMVVAAIPYPTGAAWLRHPWPRCVHMSPIDVWPSHTISAISAERETQGKDGWATQMPMRHSNCTMLSIEPLRMPSKGIGCLFRERCPLHQEVCANQHMRSPHDPTWPY